MKSQLLCLRNRHPIAYPSWRAVGRPGISTNLLHNRREKKEKGVGRRKRKHLRKSVCFFFF